MKKLLIGAGALMLSGAALAYQNTDMSMGITAQTPPAGATATATATAPGVDVALDPTVAIAPRTDWSAEQRTLWDQHMSFHPTTWTEQQRAAFQAMRNIPPVSWTPEQRLLHEQHMAALPDNWTPEQRTAYEQQVAAFRTPWMSAGQAAAASPAGVGATAAVTVRPDYRTFAGMGGPYEEVYGDGTVSLTPRPATENYPPCEPRPSDDNCIQLYERGVRDELSGWTRPTGGHSEGASATAAGGPFEPGTAARAPDPVGTTPNDPVDTQGAGMVSDNAAGIDADRAQEPDHDH